MREYIIATDSTADLPAEEFERLGIEVVPMEFLVDGTPYKHYADAREMSLDVFYEKIKAGAKVGTAQINGYTYETAFTPILEQGKDILYLCFSSGLSGTYQASVLAAEELSGKYPERKIVTIDTRCASVGEGLLVYLAGLKKKEGLSMDELEAWVYENRLKVRHWFVVDDLDHLRQGGRISAAQAILGTALGVKPLLSVDAEGKLVNTAKLRGAKKILETFCTKIGTEGADSASQTVVIGHAANLELAKRLEAVLLERGLIKAALIADIGPIIGSHVGAGMCALVYMSDRDLEQ